MATMIGDVFAAPSRFHTMIGGPGMQHQHSHESHYQGRSASRSRNQDTHAHTPRPSASPRRQGSAPSGSTRYSSQGRRDREEPTPDKNARDAHLSQHAAGGAVSRLPSPPSSSSPSEASSGGGYPQHGMPSHIPSTVDDVATEASSVSAESVSSTSTAASAATAVYTAPERAIPSPDSDTGPRANSACDAPLADRSTPFSQGDRPCSPIETQTTIHVRDLAHIQTLARADLLTATGPGILNDPPLQQMKYEISAMPINDVIEMVAALLTKITTTNDLQHDALNRNATHVRQVQAHASSEDGKESNMSPLSSSVLAFHGKNVPGITILSYLTRIHKYCPTTYEVFLSLLVYFDRMTERVNAMVMKSEEERKQQLEAQGQAAPPAGPTPNESSPDVDAEMQDDNDTESDETDSDLADDENAGAEEQGTQGRGNGGAAAPNINPNVTMAMQATYFVVDSFNIHRLIISGVTCASKFFSDVFYTNSRYAKVGGLPLAELNHLELQFLLLNDFRLAVPVEDLEAYATMLVEFYAREVVSQRSQTVVGME